MPLNFTPQPGSAVDQSNGITITSPRLLPASPPEDPSHNEYQYMLYVDGVRVDGLGLFGSEGMLEVEGRRERVFTLDIRRDWVLDSIFGFKQALGNTDDDLTFLIGLTQGLVMANMDQSSSKYGIRYLAITRHEALARRGIDHPQAELPSLAGEIVLAEAFVPACAG